MRVTGRGVTTGPRQPPVGEGVKDQGSIRASTGGHRWGQVGLRVLREPDTG